MAKHVNIAQKMNVLTERIMATGSYSSFRRLLRGSGCTRCTLSEGRSTIVVDRGNPGAGLVVIGEGPGEEEDLRGNAFVGRSGRLLDRLLAQAGIDSNRDLLIVNVIKCRPPKNRAPLPGEAEACLPFLRKQLSLVRPHTILLLGATAVRHLLPGRQKFSMKDVVGRIFASPEHPDAKMMILYHPAYLLRDPRKQPQFVRHLANLKRHRERNGSSPERRSAGQEPRCAPLIKSDGKA
jgi:DNA polymerase